MRIGRPLRWIAAALAVIVAAGAMAWLLKDPERRDLDDAARREAPGRFVRLADGMTHYETTGPDSGRVVVLAAAFSVPAYLSDSLFQRLGRDGYRAVRFDYYGRGWSDRVRSTYDLDLFARQLDGLLDSLGVPGPVDLAGLSFGAAIVTHYADRHPDRVRSLIYIDPVFNTGRQLPPEERSARAWSWYMVFRGGTEEMAAGQTYDFLHPERHPGWVARYRPQQAFRGTRAALRETRAEIAVAPHQREQIVRIARHPRPVLIVWGKQDRVAPIDESTTLRAAIPHAAFVAVDSAGHLPHLEQPDLVSRAVTGFLRR